MKFQFRLKSVLALRQYQRDVLQQSLAAAKRLHIELVEHRSQLANERLQVQEELRSMNNDQESFITDRIIVGQRYAEQLVEALMIADAEIIKAACEVQQYLSRLLVADQAVRSLERLSERQCAEHGLSDLVRSNREMEDWTRFRRDAA